MVHWWVWIESSFKPLAAVSEASVNNGIQEDHLADLILIHTAINVGLIGKNQ